MVTLYGQRNIRKIKEIQLICQETRFSRLYLNL